MTINGFTTNGTYYLSIYTTAAARQAGKYDASKYRLEVDDQWAWALNLNDDYVRITGLQIANINGGVGDNDAIRILGANCRVDSCIVYDAGVDGITFLDGATNVVVNTVVTGVAAVGIHVEEGTQYVYNCVVGASGSYAVAVDGYKVLNIKNCYSGGNTGADYFQATNGTMNLTTCYSEDGTMSTTTAAYSTSSGAYFTSVTGGAQDFHIGASSTLIGAATDLHADATYPFNTDIDADLRPNGAWDIGVDEYIAAGGSVVPQLMYYYRQQH